jgi:hypothetical protein
VACSQNNYPFPEQSVTQRQLLEQFRWECLARNTVQHTLRLATSTSTKRRDDEVKAAHTLRPNVFSAGIKQVMYRRDKCISSPGDYVKKYRMCVLFLVLLDVYVEEIDTSVTRARKLLNEPPSQMIQKAVHFLKIYYHKKIQGLTFSTLVVALV